MSAKKKSRRLVTKSREKPVEVIPGKETKHRTETRVFARKIHESFCMEPGCKFEGEHAVQNVCHTHTTMGNSSDWSYVDNIIKQGDDYLAGIQKIHKRRPAADAKFDAYIRRLESEIVCIWTNNAFTLDELVRLRGELALLKKRVGK